MVVINKYNDRLSPWSLILSLCSLLSVPPTVFAIDFEGSASIRDMQKKKRKITTKRKKNDGYGDDIRGPRITTRDSSSCSFLFDR